jgi:hypothetical protein
MRATRSGRDDKFVGSEMLNCRSLGSGRDDKGEGGASIGEWLLAEGTAGPSNAATRFARDDKGDGGVLLGICGGH